MVLFYYTMVSNNKIGIEKVPARWRAQVAQMLKDNS